MAELKISTIQVDALSIQGLTYVPGFVESLYAADLVDHFNRCAWENLNGKRRVQQYGQRYEHVTRELGELLGPLPAQLQPIAKALVEEGFFKKAPNQAIINSYKRGQGISPHIDCVPCFGDAIASISLKSAAVMNFSHPPTRQFARLLLEPGSLLVLVGDARYEWLHGIESCKNEEWQGGLIQRQHRVSITLRTVNPPR